jgi:hypothetical protein
VDGVAPRSSNAFGEGDWDNLNRLFAHSPASRIVRSFHEVESPLESLQSRKRKPLLMAAGIVPLGAVGFFLSDLPN